MEIEEYFDFVDREYATFFQKAFQMLGFNGIDGDYLEFGCHGARTFPIAYRAWLASTNRGNRHFWAYDSFAGLPEPTDARDSHRMWKPGSYNTAQDVFVDKCLAAGVGRDRFTVVPGYFSETLRSEQTASSRQPGEVALAFVDCDMFSSTKTVLEYLKPKLKHGMVIAFDDYYCYSSDRPSGERLAMLEMLQETEGVRLLEYAKFHWAGASFIVELESRAGNA